MEILKKVGREDVALVYVGSLGRGRRVEFVESLQPPIPRREKWVVIVSTMVGCPVGCAMCDAGAAYAGPLSPEEILAQVDYVVRGRFGDRVPVRKFKVQFARVGEPALNDAVLEVLKVLPRRYDAPGLMACVSTVAPAGRERFFQDLLAVKESQYPGGRFQLQFSLHTTDDRRRDRIIPVRKWPRAELAAFGARFVRPGDRKVALNFVLAEGWPLDPAAVAAAFNPDHFLIKLTPLNPTYRARAAGLTSALPPAPNGGEPEVAAALRREGFDVIVSYGEEIENAIGSNCGQYLREHEEATAPLAGGYSYPEAARV